MPKAKNIATVSTLKEKLQKAKSLVLTDYTGLTHKQLEDLHKTVKKVGAEFVVVKNSLLKIASGERANSTGPTAVLLAYEDELTPLKELFKFIKTNSKPVVKAGIFWQENYNDKQVASIAALPPKEALYANVVSRLNSPLYGLAYSLNWNLQKLVRVLEEVRTHVR